MPDVTHPTRAALLDAGLTLADERSLGAISVDDVVRHAHVAKGTFYVHFPDRAAFLVALHARFHDELRARIRAATTGQPPGAERLRRSITAYLDGCHELAGVKAMLASARGEPAIAQAVAASNDRFATAGVDDLAAMGHRPPAPVARLVVAMAAEIALVELERGAPDRAMRRALFQLLAPRG
jgi:TetR/AcrR family transcriptional regulator, transcriptional repressor for nem operon